MILVRRRFGRGIALALLGDYMDQHGARSTDLGRAQHRQQIIHIVSIDRADIAEPQFFEQRAPVRLTGYQGPRTPGTFAQWPRQGRFHAFGQPREGHQRVETAQIFRHGTDRGRNAHVIVIQDHEQTLAQIAGVVHRLIGHAGGDRAIADHGNRIARGHAQIPPGRKPQRRRDRGRGMGRAKGIERAFGTFGETGQSAFLAQGPDTVAPPRQDLVRIALMPDIKNQLVCRRIEHGMDRHSQFHDPQRGSKVPACHRDGRDHFGAQLVRQTAKFGVGQHLEV